MSKNKEIHNLAHHFHDVDGLNQYVVQIVVGQFSNPSCPGLKRSRIWLIVSMTWMVSIDSNNPHMALILVGQWTGKASNYLFLQKVNSTLLLCQLGSGALLPLGQLQSAYRPTTHR